MQFSVDGRGTHREGFVVEFKCAAGDWVGNFQRGGIGFDAAVRHPDGESVIVVAGGQGYVVDASRRMVTMMVGANITRVIVNTPEQVVLSTFTDFRALSAGGQQWRTRRLSWDGFQSLRIESGDLVGKAWTPVGDRWIEFRVQLATGEATGGAYPQGTEGLMSCPPCLE